MDLKGFVTPAKSCGIITLSFPGSLHYWNLIIILLVKLNNKQSKTSLFSEGLFHQFDNDPNRGVS